MSVKKIEEVAREAWCLDSPTFAGHKVYYVPFCTPSSTEQQNGEKLVIPSQPTLVTEPPLAARKCLEVGDASETKEATATTNDKDTPNTTTAVRDRNMIAVPHDDVMSLLTQDVSNAALVGLDAEWVRDSNTSVVQLAFTSKRAYVLHVHHNRCEPMVATDVPPTPQPEKHRHNHHRNGGSSKQNIATPPPQFRLPHPLRDILFNNDVVKAGVNVVNDAKRLTREHSREGLGEVSMLLNVDQFEVFMKEILIFPAASSSSSQVVNTTTITEPETVSGVKLVKKPTGHGLEALAYKYIGIELGKDITVTISNWEAPILSIDQICYAADDAFASLYIAATMLSSQFGPVVRAAFTATGSNNDDETSAKSSSLVKTTTVAAQTFAEMVPNHQHQQELSELIALKGFVVQPITDSEIDQQQSVSKMEGLVGGFGAWGIGLRKSVTSLTATIAPAAEIAYKNASKLLSKIENERKKQMKFLLDDAANGGGGLKVGKGAAGLDPEQVERIVRERMEEKARRKPHKHNCTSTGLGTMSASERQIMRGVRPDMVGLLDGGSSQQTQANSTDTTLDLTSNYVAQHLPVQKIATSDTSVKVLDMRGSHIFSCDQGKAKWYVEKKHLATPIKMRESHPPTQSGNPHIYTADRGKEVTFEEAVTTLKAYQLANPPSTVGINGNHRTNKKKSSSDEALQQPVAREGEEEEEDAHVVDGLAVVNDDNDDTVITKETSATAASCIAMRRDALFRYSVIQLSFDPKLKTKLCMNFQMGNCPVGEGCAFAHSIDELRRDNGRLHTEVLKDLGVLREVPSSINPSSLSTTQISRTAMKKMRADDRKLVLRLCGNSEAAASAWWTKHEAETSSGEGGGVVYSSWKRKAAVTKGSAATAASCAVEDDKPTNQADQQDGEEEGEEEEAVGEGDEDGVQITYRRPVKLLYCAICMSEGELMTHAVVPPSLRKFLPKPFHAGWSDDFVLVCLQCNPRVRVTYDVEWRRVEDEAFRVADFRALHAAKMRHQSSLSQDAASIATTPEMSNIDDIHEMPPMALVSQVIRYAQLLLDMDFCAKVPPARIVIFWETVEKHYWKLLPHVVLFQKLHSDDKDNLDGGNVVVGGGEDDEDEEGGGMQSKERSTISAAGGGEEVMGSDEDHDGIDTSSPTLRVVKKGGRRKRAGWVGGRRRIAQISGVVKVNNPNALSLAHVVEAIISERLKPTTATPLEQKQQEGVVPTTNSKAVADFSEAPPIPSVTTTTMISDEPPTTEVKLSITPQELYALARLRPKDVHNANIMRMIVSQGNFVFHHNGQVIHCDHEVIPCELRQIEIPVETTTTASQPLANENGSNTPDQNRAISFIQRWRGIFETHFKPAYIPWKPTTNQEGNTTS